MRARVTPLWPVAISPNRASEVLGVNRRVIDAHIRAGHLPVYRSGTKRRVLIEDLVALIRNHWRRGA